MGKYKGKITIQKLISRLLNLELKIKSYEILLENAFLNLHNNKGSTKNYKFINNYNKYLKFIYFKEFLIKFLTYKLEQKLILS